MNAKAQWKTVNIAASAAIAVMAQQASAGISIVNQAEGFMGSTKTNIATAHNGGTLLDYNATGIDKLIVGFGFESGFNNQSATALSVSFNGAAFTEVVQENFHDGTWDGGTASIWYLDNPFQGTANLTVSYTTSGGGPNGGYVSIMGLAGTADGVGNSNGTWSTQAAAGNVSTTLTTSGNDSVVFAFMENSGRNSGAGSPTATGDLTLSNNGFWGSQWGSGAGAYQEVASSGTNLTPTFSTNAGGNIHVVAAEFLVAAPIPEPSSALLLGLGSLLLLRRRR